jgi:phosphocarrier protein HPr
VLSKDFIVNCNEGFHLRPAQVLMETATPFASDIILKRSDEEEADAKSILGLMSLGLEKGEAVVLEINGADENEAMTAIEKLFDNNFGE